MPFVRQTESTFSEAEAAQLCELFELSDTELTLLLSGSAYIFEVTGPARTQQSACVRHRGLCRESTLPLTPVSPGGRVLDDTSSQTCVGASRGRG